MIRADAVRNREKVLDAAEEVLAEQGPAARMDEIARRAGVGVGTLYRHFATKEALCQAIIADRVDGLLRSAARLRVTAEPGAAFFTFFEQVVADAAGKKSLNDALLSAGIDPKRGHEDRSAQMREAIGTLLAAAQQAGAVRAGVALPDVLALLRAAGLAAENGSFPRTALEIIFAGLA